MISDNDAVEINFLSINKELGSKLIVYLKDLNLINDEYKIDSDGLNVYIPIHDISASHPVFKNFRVVVLQRESSKKNKKLKSIQEILSAEIPTDLTESIPSSYDIIGEIVVVDIKNELMKYKSHIGSAIIKLNPSITSVYIKSSSVKGPYRIRELELISGKNNYITIHKEYGLQIYLDLSKIYFSPRLSTEHYRIAKSVHSNESVLDLFAASGIFALHIAKIVVSEIFSVDINPDAEILLNQSIKINKSLRGSIIPKTGDATKIISEFIKEEKYFDRIIMNHPSGAIDYLYQAFKLLKTNGIVHFYLFSLIEDNKNYCSLIIQKHLITGYEIIDIHQVRQYSASEYHTCVTIKKI